MEFRILNLIMKLKIFTDGGARGNPGPAASGVVVQNEKGAVLSAFGEYLGEQTNNFAEYSALIAGLKMAKKLEATEVECYLDSELVVKQMRQEYKVREPGLQKLFVHAFNEATQFNKVHYIHIPREKNRAADEQVNKILDRINRK